MKHSLLILSAVILAACTACAQTPPGVDPTINAAAHVTYCAAKQVYCAGSNEGLSNDALQAKTLACAVNVICAPASPASGVVK